MKSWARWLSYTWLGMIFLGIIYAQYGMGEIPINVNEVLLNPNEKYLFGTDSLGRNFLLRCLNGLKSSFIVGIVSSFFALSLGLVYGGLAGWQGRQLDRIMMRTTEILIALPSFALVAVVTLFVQANLLIQNIYLKSILSLIIGIALSHWMNIARTIRGSVAKIKQEPYIEAAIALGASDFYLFRRHILPNISRQVIVLFGLQFAGNILYESLMSFLGIGIQSPETSLGLLIYDGWKSLSSFPHLMLFPAFLLFLTVWSIHVLIDDYFMH